MPVAPVPAAARADDTVLAVAEEVFRRAVEEPGTVDECGYRAVQEAAAIIAFNALYGSES